MEGEMSEPRSRSDYYRELLKATEQALKEEKQKSARLALDASLARRQAATTEAGWSDMFKIAMKNGDAVLATQREIDDLKRAMLDLTWTPMPHRKGYKLQFGNVTGTVVPSPEGGMSWECYYDDVGGLFSFGTNGRKDNLQDAMYECEKLAQTLSST